MKTTISQHFDTKFMRGLAGVAGRRTRKQLLQEMTSDVLTSVDMAKGLSGRNDLSGAATKLTTASEVMGQAIDLAETLPGVAFPKARAQAQMAVKRLSNVDELSIENPTAARQHLLVCAAALAKSAELVALFASRLNDAMEKSTESLGFHEDWLIKEFNGSAVIEKEGEGRPGPTPKLGSGKRFERLTEELEEKKENDGEVDDDVPEEDTDVNPEDEDGVDKGAVQDPKALAAWIGRKKYGKKKYQEMAAEGKKEKEAEADDEEESLDIAEKINDIIAAKMLEKTGPKGQGADWEKRTWGSAIYVKIPGTGWRRYSKKMQAQDKAGGGMGTGEWVKQFGLKPKAGKGGKVSAKAAQGKVKAKAKAKDKDKAKAKAKDKAKAKGKVAEGKPAKAKAAAKAKSVKTPKYTIDKKAKAYAKELLGNDTEDVLNNMAAFKETLGPRGRGRSEAQLKRDFIANMDSAKYKDQKAFVAAKERMQKLSPKEFGIILAAINLDTEEADAPTA